MAKMADMTYDKGNDLVENGNLLDVEIEKQDAKCHINRTMLPCKIAYFSLISTHGALEPFMNVFLRSVGFSPARAGFITGIRQLAQIIGNPLWSIIGDRSRKHKQLIVLVAVLATGINFCLPWIGKPTEEMKPGHIKSNNSMLAKNSSSNDTILKPNPQFVSIAAVTFSAGFVESSLESYVTARTMKMIEYNNDGSTYGGQRFVGEIGYALSSLITSILTEVVHKDGFSVYTPLYFVFLTGIASIYCKLFLLIPQKS